MGTDILKNVARVRERIEAACRRAGGRPTESVRLVAATKTVEPDRLREAYAAGVREFGENRVQEAEAKVAVLRDLSITWHMIGHVQTNKARAVSELFDWVHSVDSLRVAEKLSSARDGQKKVPVLIEVNLGGEGTKSGAQETEAARLAESLSRLSGLSLRGLMAVPPFFNDCEMARPYFRRLRRLAQQIESLRLPGVAMTELSMGMSQDFEIAIEEGSTIIRVGTAIFGPRS